MRPGVSGSVPSLDLQQQESPAMRPRALHSGADRPPGVSGGAPSPRRSTLVPSTATLSPQKAPMYWGSMAFDGVKIKKPVRGSWQVDAEQEGPQWGKVI